MNAIRQFRNPVDLRIGSGSLGVLAGVLKNRAFAVITTPGMARRDDWTMLQANLPHEPLSIATIGGNPTARTIDACRAATDESAAVIVAYGGGSVIDTAKCVAWLNGRGGNGIVRGLRTTEPPHRQPGIVAIPTTAGTGSEVTCWATVWDPEGGRKYSLSHPSLYPEIALLDPRTLRSLPFEQSLITALDALSHACEAVWNRQANPVAAALAERAITGLTSALAGDYRGEFARDDRREQVQHASLLAGLAFSSTRTALCHSISYPLTNLWHVAHGLAASMTLPEVCALALSRAVDIEPIARGLRTSAAEAPARLGTLLDESGADRLTANQIASSKTVNDVAALLLTPGRSDNFASHVDEAEAVDVLARALMRIRKV